MLVEVKVPVLSESIAEASLLTWHKKVGEAVARDENLIDVETGKVIEFVDPELEQLQRQIAEKLNRSIKTIEAHRANLKDTLQLKSGRDLVRFAVQWLDAG